jgi:hypothetical protein
VRGGGLPVGLHAGPHHALLGSSFLTSPPICKIRVDVAGGEHRLTHALGASLVVEDQSYFRAPAPRLERILRPRTTAPTDVAGDRTLYPIDTSLQPDGRTRVLGYTRDAGKGGVAYAALGHCRNPAIRAERVADPTDTTPRTFRGS